MRKMKLERETSLENQGKMLAHLPKPSAAAGTNHSPESELGAGENGMKGGTDLTYAWPI